MDRVADKKNGIIYILGTIAAAIIIAALSFWTGSVLKEKENLEEQEATASEIQRIIYNMEFFQMKQELSALQERAVELEDEYDRLAEELETVKKALEEKEKTGGKAEGEGEGTPEKAPAG